MSDSAVLIYACTSDEELGWCKRCQWYVLSCIIPALVATVLIIDICALGPDMAKMMEQLKKFDTKAAASDIPEVDQDSDDDDGM